MSAIIIDNNPGEDLVRCVNLFGADEANIENRSFKPDHRGAFWIPRHFVTHELRHVGGFHPTPLTLAEAIEDVENAVGRMPDGGHKYALAELLAELTAPRSV